ncbi:MAG: 1-(5-phosphoribosyl)-5-[(5-phosphoribosylamino)methylideneamino]imidazole-4-carboxamide isomerase [Fimbriimonadaceae bacterium]|nr:1-(5-phosphoribosyl)-5-[(5-phosphoribosylamino)methylideneamino]imidazole-4-carboxamide isomerase [Fimbriimonadaceae bacterium]
MLILPAIDLVDGTCVRLHQGNFDEATSYALDPLEVAKSFADDGAEWIHIVDLDGAKSGSPRNLRAIAEICLHCPAKIELGGGIRSLEIAQNALDQGVSRVILGSRLAGNLDVCHEIFAALGERVVAGLDMRNGKVAVSGWTEATTIDGLELALKLQDMGARRFILTDIATDGTLAGPNLDMLNKFVRELDRPVIASGGISSLEDLMTVSKIQPPIEGTIVGKALYERRFTVAQAISSVR